MPVRTFDLKNVVCTVGGVPISGYGEEDAVRFDWVGDLVERQETVEGGIIYARRLGREVLCTITLMATSRAISLLQGLFTAQHGVPAVIVPLPFYFVDPALGDFVSGQCVFLRHPLPSKGRTVGEVEYQLSLSNPVVQLGVFNVL